MSYVTGSHRCVSVVPTAGNRRNIIVHTGDVAPITFNNGAPVSVTFVCRATSAKASSAIRSLRAGQVVAWPRHGLNLGIRYDNFVGNTQEEGFARRPLQLGGAPQQVPRRQEQREERLRWRRAELEGHLSARRCGVGRVRQRQDGHEGEHRARYVNGEAVGTAAAGSNRFDSVAWPSSTPVRGTDVDKNGSPSTRLATSS